jgi:hypothetical protein
MGCDQGAKDDQPIVVGPPIALVPGGSDAGLTNVGMTQTLPADQPIVLQFNRLLNPYSVTRQSIVLTSSSGEVFADPVIDYDPVLMTVTLSNPGGGSTWLVAGQSYEISFPVPTSPTDINGLQAIDDATFAALTTLAFTVSASTGNQPVPPTMHFCVDILPIFERNCAGSNCHGRPNGESLSRAGLVLDSSEGLALTAIGQVAHGSNTGANAGVTQSPGTIFGVDMPIIDPGNAGTGNPANSWLLYKVLLAVPPAPSAGGDLVYQCNGSPTNESFGLTTAAEGGLLASPPAMKSERLILSNFILGREMPYPDPTYTEIDAGPSTSNLSVQELERIRLWIKQGAQLETVTMLGPNGEVVSLGTNCGLCQAGGDAGTSSPSTDAGTDGPSDAGTQ